MEYQRLYEKTVVPTENDIIDYVGECSQHWLNITNYLAEYHSTWEPEIKYYAKNYGWTMRYRKGGKTLISLFPEKDSYSVLIILGRAEVDKANLKINDMSSEVQSTFLNTDQLHDGRWLWIRVKNEINVDSIKILINSKAKPMK